MSHPHRQGVFRAFRFPSRGVSAIFPALPALAALPLLAALAGCSGVYFNTTFNAEKAHAQALRLRAERLERDPDDTVSVNPEERAKLVRAITKSSKVLELWPRHPEYAPRAVFRIAECQLLLGDYASAAQKYDEFLRNFPEHEKVPLARVRMAQAHYEDGKDLAAREALEDALAANPEGEARREALLLQARMRIDGQSGEEGLALYEQLLSEGAFPTVEGRNEARWRAARLAYELGHWEKAREHALAANEGALPFRIELRNRRLANLALIEAGRIAEAREEARALAREGKLRAFRGDFRLLEARAAQGLGDWPAARALYLEAIRLEPRSAVAAESWYRLGLHALDAEGNEDSARVFFDSAARSGTGFEYGMRGSEDGAALARLSELRVVDTTGADSAQPHRRSFMIAELFQFRLPRPDSARVHLERIVNSPVEDTAYTRRAFFALAWLESEAGNSARAESLYRVVLERWPGTEWAQRAESELGLPPTVRTVDDKARELFLAAEARLIAGDPPARVAPAYRRVIEEYPDSRLAPRAKFALAVLAERAALANPGKEAADSARAAYEAVRDGYPGTPYASAADNWMASLDNVLATADSPPPSYTTEEEFEEMEGDEVPRVERLDSRGEEDLY